MEMTKGEELLHRIVKRSVQSYTCNVCDGCADAMAISVVLKLKHAGYILMEEDKLASTKEEAFKAGMEACVAENPEKWDNLDAIIENAKQEERDKIVAEITGLF